MLHFGLAAWMARGRGDEAQEGQATSDEVSGWPSWVDGGAEAAVFRGILVALSPLSVFQGVQCVRISVG